jgi:small-conductance mechanosensitive channel
MAALVAWSTWAVGNTHGHAQRAKEAPLVQQIWAKFTANERLTAIGAALVILGAIVSGAGRGLVGAGSLGLLAAIAALVVLYLKYAPNTNITWPLPPGQILMALSAVVAIIALLNLIDLLGYISLLAQYGGATTVIGLAAYWIGAGLMGWSAYKEWTASKTAA